MAAILFAAAIKARATGFARAEADPVRIEAPR
jgi:hypothetical protein